MKLILTLGAVLLCIHVCHPRIIGIPGKYVGRKPKPTHGACFHNNEIMCSQAGMKVQYDGENCVDCTCLGEGAGILCCNVEPYPIVCHPSLCTVYLNTTLCQYERHRDPVDTIPSGKVKMWKQSCIIEKYEIADLAAAGLSDDWEPDNPKFEDHDEKEPLPVKTRA